MAEKVSSKTDLWKLQSEFNEKMNSDLNEIQEMMNSMMDTIRGLNKSTSSQNFQSSSSSIAAARKCAIPPLEAGIRVTDGAGPSSPLKMDTPGVEESIISLEELTRQIREDKVFEEMFLPNPIDTAENQGAEDGKFQLQLKTNQQQWNTLDPWSESENENGNGNKHLTVEEYEQNEGNNDNEGDVLSFGEMLSVLVLENEATVNGSAMGSLMAWVKGVIPSMEVVWDQNVWRNDTHKVFHEITDLVPTARHSFSSVSLIRNERNDVSILNRADYCKFDEVLGPFSVKHNTRIDIQEVLEPPTFDLLKILGCDFINSNGLKQDFDKMASNLNVDFGVDGILMFVFDPGGNSSLQMDLFIDRDVCEAVLGRPCAIKDRAMLQCLFGMLSRIWIIIALLCGVIFRFDCAFLQNGPDIFVELGTWKMNYHVHDLIVNYLLAIKAIIETSELLCKRDVDWSSCVELLTALYGYTLHNDRRKELCDEELQWKCGDQFRTKRGDMVTLLSSVYHSISSSPVCCGMIGNGHDSITLQRITEEGGYAYVRMESLAAGGDMRAAEAAREMACEQLHSGPWHSVVPIWRDAYAMACLHMAKMHYEAGEFSLAIRALDLGLIMGGFKLRDDLNSAINKASKKACSLAMPMASSDPVNIVSEQVDLAQVRYQLPLKSLSCKMVGKVLLFIFDPGGSEPFESTVVTQNLSKSSENHNQNSLGGAWEIKHVVLQNICSSMHLRNQEKTIAHAPVLPLEETFDSRWVHMPNELDECLILILGVVAREYMETQGEIPCVMKIEDRFIIIKVQNFIWDTGWCVIIFFNEYILGDKDVFEREGKRMVCIGVMQWDMIMRYIVNAAKLRNEDFCVWCLSSLHGLVAATLAARVTLKDNSRATEVLANMKSVCDWNNVSGKVKGFPRGDVLYDAKAFDSWRHFLDDIVLAAIFENFVWDPGLFFMLL